MWIFKFHSTSSFILLLILFETTCYFRNSWSSDRYVQSANYTYFIFYFLKAFWLFKFHSYCLLAFFIWNDSLILRQSIFQNSFYFVCKLSDLVCKLRKFYFPFLHTLFGTSISFKWACLQITWECSNSFIAI